MVSETQKAIANEIAECDEQIQNMQSIITDLDKSIQWLMIRRKKLQQAILETYPEIREKE